MTDQKKPPPKQDIEGEAFLAAIQDPAKRKEVITILARAGLIRA